MKDQTDKKTGDLLRSAVSKRQAAFRARQLAIGRRQRPLWLTDVELAAVSAPGSDTGNHSNSDKSGSRTCLHHVRGPDHKT